MPTLTKRLNQIRIKISTSAKQANRTAGDITLLAVSKNELSDSPITWHFIGPIQSNKTKPIAENFDWVHSICSIKIATRLNNQRPKELPPINALVQINIDNEASKSGLALEELPKFLAQSRDLTQLNFRGLMCLPLNTDDPTKQRESFAKLRELRDGLKSDYPDLILLSMGMSKDFNSAIQEGSNIVRIGTALFGPRP